MEIILGVFASLLTQWLKKYGSSEYHTLAILGVISLALAGIYAALVAIGYWETVVSILIVAGVIYTFIIQRFEK